jgi:hypothetical protein
MVTTIIMVIVDIIIIKVTAVMTVIMKNEKSLFHCLFSFYNKTFMLRLGFGFFNWVLIEIWVL